MKGYANVCRSDVFSAIIGFEVRIDMAKEIRDKGINLYYEKYYANGNRWVKWVNRKKKPIQFVRDRLGFCQSWDEILYEVLTTDEIAELGWWCWCQRSDVEPLTALYKATSDETILVDDKMAKFIIEYKEWLECVQ